MLRLVSGFSSGGNELEKVIAVEAAMLAVRFALRERIGVVVTLTVVTGRVSQQSVCVVSLFVRRTVLELRKKNGTAPGRRRACVFCRQ